MSSQVSLERGQSKAARRIRSLGRLTHKERWKRIALCHQEEKTTGRCAGSSANKLAQMQEAKGMQQEAKGMQQLDSTTRKRDLTSQSTKPPV